MSEQSALSVLTFNNVAQPIFDKVWERAKNKTHAKDAHSGNCKYRVNRSLGATDANACFIGVCMTDEEYSPSFENSPIAELWRQGRWYPQGYHQIPDVVQRRQLKFMCEDLQTIHDCMPPAFWQQKLRELAQSYNLTIPTEKDQSNDPS